MTNNESMQPVGGQKNDEMGEYRMVTEPTQTPLQPESARAPEVIIRHENSNGNRGRRVVAYTAGIVLAVSGAAVAVNYALDSLWSGAKDLAPKPEETFDIEEIRSRMGSVASVASGQIESEADVYSKRRYLLADAECDTNVTGSQSFVMIPREDGSNIRFDKADKTIVVDLEDNPVEVGEQRITMGDPSDCSADAVGQFFGDESKAYEIAASQAPDALREQTELENGQQLMEQQRGEVGQKIAASAAATYDAIGGGVLDAIGRGDISMEFRYYGQPVLPESEGQLVVEIEAHPIEAR